MYHNIINLECNRAVREGVKISEVQKTATKLISEINMYVLHEPGTEKYRAGLREIHRQIKARLARLKTNQEINNPLTGGPPRPLQIQVWMNFCTGVSVWYLHAVVIENHLTEVESSAQHAGAALVRGQRLDMPPQNRHNGCHAHMR